MDHIRRGEHKARLSDMFQNAERSVEVLASWSLLQGNVLALLKPIPQSVQVDIITDSWRGERPSRFRVSVHPLGALYEAHAPPGRGLRYENSGVFLVDDAKALVWMGSAGEQPSALYSESSGLVQFVRRYLASVAEWVAAASP